MDADIPGGSTAGENHLHLSKKAGQLPAAALSRHISNFMMTVAASARVAFSFG